MRENIERKSWNFQRATYTTRHFNKTENSCSLANEIKKYLILSDLIGRDRDTTEYEQE